tara:strand:+ start:9443 stop:10477 length:1035 start_codon:yes stop_codon:yes gene_type:complete
MVRVYRSDLGYGQGTDGQNYYEVSEERAAELAKAGYTTNPGEAMAGRSGEGGSIYTGTDDVSFYSDVDSAMSGVSDTASGRSSSTGAALAKSLFSMFPQKFIDKYAEFWVTYGNKDIAIGMLRKEPMYEDMFGYLLRDDGTLIMTELEAMSNKASFRNTLAEFGIPYAEAFDKQFETMITNLVSPEEFDTRVNIVYDAVIDDIPQVAELYAQQHGIEGVTPELILAGLLNPDIQDAILNNDIATLQIGAEATSKGYSFEFSKFERYRKQGLTRETAKNIYSNAEPIISQAAGLGRNVNVDTLAEAAIGNTEAMSAVQKAANEAISASSFVTGSRKKGDKVTGLT